MRTQALTNLLPFAIFLAILFGFTTNIFAATGGSQDFQVATLLSPKGKKLRLYSNNVRNLVDSGINIRGAQLSSERHLCSALESTHYELTRLETALELNYIIENMKSKKDFVSFTPLQRLTLAKTPMCQPFMMELAIIAKLSQGYKLVEVESRNN